MRRTYVTLTVVVVVAVFAQLCFVALGSFDSSRSQVWFRVHSLTGLAVIPATALLATLAAAAIRAPRKLIWLTALPIGLVVVQALVISLGGLNDGLTLQNLVMLATHDLVGSATFLVALYVADQSRHLTTNNGAHRKSAG